MSTFKPLALVATFALIFNVPAWAQLPADTTIHMLFHQAPRDQSSSVVFTITATLQAYDRHDNSVGWTVVSLEFVQKASTETKSWVEYYPLLDTADGLWWVTHDDPLAPGTQEFLTTPRLAGVATADDPADFDLRYDVLGQASPEPDPYQNTSLTTYALAAADTNEPVKDGEDEPVETRDYRDMD